VFGGVAKTRLGTETMLAVLQGDNRYSESLAYTVGLLQIEKKFRRAERMQQEVGTQLERISKIGAELEQHEREDLQAHDIAALYSNTISKLSPRIVVNGRPQYLKSERTVDWVRTLLMAGLRSAILWSQLGGGRFELMFGRKNLIREAESLLMN
jgi:high frequency lysogenization protein